MKQSTSWAGPWPHLIGVGTLVAGLAFSDQIFAERWIDTTFAECQVWSAESIETESVAWTGQCVDGKASGDGVLVVSDKDGFVGLYEGEMKTGRLDGNGFIAMRNADTGGVDTYEGEFANGTLHGVGVLDSSEGWVYEGEFKDGKQHGEGAIETEDGAYFRSAFENGEPVGSALAYYNTDAGETYFGEVQNGERHGNGHLVKANQDVYIGEFEDGVAAGMGTYDVNDSGVYVGMFEQGIANGYGTYLAPNGDVMQGRFVDGKPDGQMLLTRGDSQTVETWINGEKQ